MTTQPTFAVRYSPMNQAWFILFGRNLETASVLGIYATRADAVAVLESWQELDPEE